LAQKFSGIKVYNALALTVLLYGIEIWSLRKEREREREKKRLTSIKMKLSE